MMSLRFGALAMRQVGRPEGLRNDNLGVGRLLIESGILAILVGCDDQCVTLAYIGSLSFHAEYGRTFVVRAAISREELLLRIAVLLWLIGLLIWQRIDRGISEAISEDEDAAAAVDIDVMREKMRATVISAALMAIRGSSNVSQS
jgi:ABC-type branched-subunit amino acid transport system permease subunit